MTPLLYVLAMGVLLGGFIDGDPAKLEGAPSYLAFVAPGLVAAQAMQVASARSTYPVMGDDQVAASTYYGDDRHAAARRATWSSPTSASWSSGSATTCAVFLVVMAPFGVFALVRRACSLALPRRSCSSGWPSPRRSTRSRPALQGRERRSR